MRISDWSSDVCSSDLLGRDDVRELCHRNRRDGDEAGERDNDRNDERDPRPVDEDVEHGSDPAVGRGRGRDGLTRSNLLQAFDDDLLALLEALGDDDIGRSEEHTSELQSLMRISYAGFCLKKKKTQQ